MYHMIGCPYVSYISFMIKTAKRWLYEKREILKRSQYIRIINEICHPNYKIPWNELKKKSPSYIIYTIQMHISKHMFSSICETSILGPSD